MCPDYRGAGAAPTIDAPASGAVGTDRARRAHLREVSEAFAEMVLGASQLQPRRR